MRWTGYVLIIFNILLIGMIFIYFLPPMEETQINFKEQNNNFTLENKSVKIQFYENMRFPKTNISYNINPDCNLEKKGNMIQAFEIVENETVLSFYPVEENEEITISCEEKNKIEEGMFIAGEGGPTNITETKRFNIILHGNILLIKNSDCQKPNVAIHELLHVLGFDHSENKNNILYPISSCSQKIGPELPEIIKELYSTKPLPDLSIEEAVANIDGRTLDLNISIRNEGLQASESAKIMIYTDDRLIKELNLDSINIGFGLKVMLQNIWLTKTKIEELKIVIKTDFEEIDLSNNEVLLLKN